MHDGQENTAMVLNDPTSTQMSVKVYSMTAYLQRCTKMPNAINTK